MVKGSMALAEYLRNAGLDADRDFLGEGIVLLTQLLMEAVLDLFRVQPARNPCD